MAKRDYKEILKWTIFIALVVIIVSGIIVWFISYNQGRDEGFKEGNKTAYQELEPKIRLAQGCEVKIADINQTLNETIKELGECRTDLEQREDELKDYRNSTGKFPLFWKFGDLNINFLEVHLTKFWINAINITITISLAIVLFEIVFRIRIGGDKKNRKK